ncbi:flagellin [Citricoccus sp. I39-566]|uniref:flagellin N-terminal helical domain-containing protein n=1 Tax=Citricoccus sp. I39-566 TaxID=3073268 RepID=UPI00286C7B2C|nr:flagellin [Citricoccus sp. I39-566]WMY77989.1 flagellin [Citricoccus sp. I39-566]
MTVINTNVAANNTYRMMSIASEEKASSMEKLSSGLRINRAADDAAGLSIAEGLRSQSNGLEVAARNINDAISLAQTAEGGLSAAGDILQRVRDLAVQAGNDTLNTEARAAITTEVTQLTAELTRMSESINFNDAKLLDGTGTFSFQVGANGGTDAASSSDTIALSISTNLADIATTVGALDFSSADGASAAIVALDTAITGISSDRSNIGAVQNRLEHTLKHVNVTAENLINAESNIRDVDMAKEIVKQSAANIKEQASQAMLAQANQASQNVLQLLR